MVVRPLPPAEIGALLGLPAKDALDAYLAIGGLPRLAEVWRDGERLWKFLGRELADPESPLVVLGERAISRELPAETKARDVLEAIGDGETGFTAISRRAGVTAMTVEAALGTLGAKGIAMKSLPYSAVARPKLTRYSVADPYLAFWLRFVRPNLPVIERGRGDMVLEMVKRSWQPYAGRAVEPVVREAVGGMLPDRRFGGAQHVGSYWTRDNSVEVDVVGGRGPDGSAAIDCVGSITWRDTGAFDRSDLGALTRLRAQVPGAGDGALLVGISRNGFAKDVGLDVELSPDDIIAAGHGPGCGD